MTDKELLELAAKSVGIELIYWSESQSSFVISSNQDYWNPLTDDGDALRLAVKLGIGINVSESLSQIYCWTDSDDIYEQFDNDTYAATRRAIVRAAAEIGKTL